MAKQGDGLPFERRALGLIALLLFAMVSVEIDRRNDPAPKRTGAPLRVIPAWKSDRGRSRTLPDTRVKVAIVLPYRDRPVHLAGFEAHMLQFAEEQFPEAQISLWIMEQGNDEKFTRGWLGNVGVKEVLKEQPDTKCIVFHDVDLVPEFGVPYLDCDRPTQLSSELETWKTTDGKWGVPYPKNAGGIVSLSPLHWLQTNGFSNEYVGHGQEDDDFFHRLRMNKLLEPSGCIHRNPTGQGRFRPLDEGTANHPRNHGSKHWSHNHNKQLLYFAWGDKASKQDRWKNSHYWEKDGISTAAYTVINRESKKASPRGSLTQYKVTVVPDATKAKPGEAKLYTVEELNLTTTRPNCKST
jgi:hypothetical protein